MKNSSLLMQRALEVQLPRVLDRYMAEKGVSPDEAKKHAAELFRYLVLRARNPDARYPLASGPVDNLWHNFLLFTQEYAGFCQYVCGEFIHHQPGPPCPTSAEVEEAQRDFDKFVEVYQNTYSKSPPPDLWARIGEPGVLWSC